VSEMLPPLATLGQLDARVPEEIEIGDPRAEAALEDASAAVRHAARRSWVNEFGELEGVPDIAVTITLAVAKRIWSNPYDYRSEQIGEYANQRSATGLLTEAERHDLADLAGDLVSVELQADYVPNSPSQHLLDVRRGHGSTWWL
jgi:hypothetical protein